MQANLVPKYPSTTYTRQKPYSLRSSISVAQYNAFPRCNHPYEMALSSISLLLLQVELQTVSFIRDSQYAIEHKSNIGFEY